MRKLKLLLLSWLTATKQLFTVRWNTWKVRRAEKQTPLRLEEKALEDIIRTKDEFIVYLQDEVNWLRALLKEDKIERVRNEVEFKSSRGYKSVFSRIRENVLAQQARQRPYPVVKETEYEQQEVE